MLEEYARASYIFVSYISLIVRGLLFDYVMVIFPALATPSYNIVDKIKRVVMMKIFEEFQAWIDNKLVSKMKSFSQI